MAEAYGVLGDPDKRSQYDTARAYGAHRAQGGGEFRYTQDEILRDLFRDPRFQQVFQGLFREFQRFGLRSNRRFMDQVFFGGRGFFVAGIFFFGLFGQGGPARGRVPYRRPPAVTFRPPKFLETVKRLGRKVGGYLLGEKRLPAPGAVAEEAGSGLDMTFRIALAPGRLRDGTDVTITVDRGGGSESLRVRVPPGTRSGTRLRLRGKGREREGAVGDLFLEITGGQGHGV